VLVRFPRVDRLRLRTKQPGRFPAVFLRHALFHNANILEPAFHATSTNLAALGS
jgi:hypothetical protein